MNIDNPIKHPLRGSLISKKKRKYEILTLEWSAQRRRTAKGPVQACIQSKDVSLPWALYSVSPLGPHFEGL